MKPRHQNPLSLAARSTNLRGLCTITFCALAAGQVAQAATATWDGATNANWNADNWSGGLGVGGAPVANDTLTFAGTTQTTTNNDFAANTQFNGISFSNTVAGQSFTLNGSNAITLNGNITTASAAGAITDTINLNLILNGNRNIDGHDNRTVIVNGIISQNDSTARNLTKGGGGSGGTLTLTGNNTYTGNTIIQTGTLSVAKIADAGSGLDSNMGFGTKFLLGNNNTVATLNYTGSGDTTARTLDISSSGGNNNGGATINQNGANGGSGLVFSATNFTNTVATSQGERTLTLGGSNTDANQISGRIANMDEDRILKLTKSGAGRWILAGASIYTGVTAVNAGTLVVTGSLTSNVTVGTATLAGTGTTTGTLTLNNNSTIVGTTIGSSFKAETVTANATVKVAGSDGSGTIGSHTIGVVRYNSGTGPTTTNFSVAGYHSGATVANVGGAGGETQLTYTNAARTWNSASGTWDAMTSNSWQEGDLKFGHGDAVTFNDSGTGGGNARPVTLNSLVTPGSVTFDNTTTTPYTVSGTGDIGGLTALTKSGNGTVTLSTVNTYAGATNVSAGKLVVSGSIAASDVTVSGSGAILASDTAASIGKTLTVNNGAVLAVGDAANATTATATVTGATTFNNGSIFSWDINALGDSYDKLITTSVLGEVTAGDAVFRIVAADATFADAFWNNDRTWTDIFTTNGTTAIANWATIFGSSVSLVNSTFDPITSSRGSFSASGNTLTWTAVPEPTSALAGILLSAGLLRRRRA